MVEAADQNIENKQITMEDVNKKSDSIEESAAMFTEYRDGLFNTITNLVLIMKAEVSKYRSKEDYEIIFNMLLIIEQIQLLNRLTTSSSQELIFNNYCE